MRAIFSKNKKGVENQSIGTIVTMILVFAAAVLFLYLILKFIVKPF